MQQGPQIEPGDMDDIALLSILDSPEKAAPHTAPVKAMGKTPSTRSHRARKSALLFSDFNRARLPRTASLAAVSPRQHKGPLRFGSLIRLLRLYSLGRIKSGRAATPK